MLTASDLEVNVLEFRHRAFQFDRLAEIPGGPWALFSRTETESERQLRPRLVRLTVVVPLAWVVLDPVSEALRVARDGKVGPIKDVAAIEVAAEPSEFTEDGVAWHRSATGNSGYVYIPAELGPTVGTPQALAALGLG